MRTLVVGFGSIGQRHARLLHEIGALPPIVSRRRLPDAFATIADALRVHRPDLVVIATETAEHYAAIASLARCGYAGRVLVEKPLFDRCRELPANAFLDLRVAYNLRCHALVRALRASLGNRRPCIVQAAVGQYLPDWRPGRAWQQGYSADPVRGGGVLRDLSHELDLLLWLCGPWRRVAALGGRSGLLPIASDDHWSILIDFASGASATLQLNYLSRPGRRLLAVEHADGTVVADFIANTLCENADVQRLNADRDHSYLALLRRALAGDVDELCDAAGGQAVVRLIQAVEQAAQAGTWVAAPGSITEQRQGSASAAGGGTNSGG